MGRPANTLASWCGDGQADTLLAPGVDVRAGTRRAAARAEVCGKFWETLHIDLRMVDTSDFTIAYCPTNISSVGTPHEIALCRQQRKPAIPWR